MRQGQGFRWTGNGFARLPAGATTPMASPGARTLQADDQGEAEEQARSVGPVPPEGRERLKAAGWHFKHLSGYEGIQGPVALPIALRSQSCTLLLRSQKRAEVKNVATTMSFPPRSRSSSRGSIAHGSRPSAATWKA
jgi:hypothetical protein